MRPLRLTHALLALGLASAAAGCRQDMHDQQKVEPLESTPFFADGRGSRQPVEGTVPRGQLHEDRHYWEGRYAADGTGPAGEPVDSFPMPVTKELLARGRERYDIYCTPCHSKTGEGDGMIVRRGYQRPPSFHTEALRNQKVGHLFEVIGKGLGAMPSYAAQIGVADRWAIVAYMRALQRSQQATMADVPEAERAKLLASKDKPATAPAAPATAAPAQGGH